MRELTKQEVAVMWLWPRAYAESGAGAVEYYARLDDREKQFIEELLDHLEAVKRGPKPRRSR